VFRLIHMDETTGTGLTPGAVARRRYLCILFADLSDSTRLAATMEAEQYAEILNGLRLACREIIPKHGGRIAQLLGDGVLAIFGYPDAREDDGRRATEAALELHAAVRRIQVANPAGASIYLGLHSGIHAGIVLLGEGNLELGRFELLGNVPNIAARLADHAEFDEIYVSEDTLGPAADFFVTSPRQDLNVKGWAQPLSVCRVLGRAANRSRFEARKQRGLTPFVGRLAEMLELERHLRDVAAGKAKFVTVTAGPGVGKTRLVEEFLAGVSAVEFQIHRGYCESYLSAEPLQPFVQMLRRLFGLLHDNSAAEARELAESALQRLDPKLLVHCAELLRALSIVAPGSEGHRPSATGTVVALRELFDALALSRPLILLVDDWQWADDASRQVLRSIVMLGRPILAVVATRGSAAGDLEAIPTESIDLQPLDIDDGEHAVRRLLPGVAPFVATEIHGYAGGNPLFIEELCHSAAAEGAGRRPVMGSAYTGATWLNTLIETRVARLPQPQADIVRAAAVIGNVFPAWLLERITGHGENDALVLALAEEDFVFPTGRAGMLRFKHGITRDAIYNAVGLNQRREIHLRAAVALSAQGDSPAREDSYEALAYHYAGADQFAEAARFAELAGDKAMAATALDRARIHFRAALAALDRLGTTRREVQLRWCSVVQKLGMACVFDPLGFDDEPALFERGVALARDSGDAEALARAEYWLGYFYYAKGRARDAQVHCKWSLDLALGLPDQRLAVQVRATLGQVLTSASDYDLALELLDAAIEEKRRFGKGKGGLNVAVGSAYTLSCKGLLLGDRGLFAQAQECFAEALAMVDGTNHQVESSVQGWVSAVHLWQGRWDDALQAANATARVADHVRSSHLFAMGRALGGYARWMLTSEPEALQTVVDATSWIEVRKGKVFTSLNHGWLVDGFVTQRRHEDARRHAARALVRARERDRLGEAMAYRGLARACANAMEHARAEHYLDKALCAAQARGSPHERAVTLLCRAEVEIGRGRRPEARHFLEEACKAFEAMAMKWHLARAEAL
jgi:class 3 adenylate cyclase/tetratricopeptide (TPR) repeat protein